MFAKLSKGARHSNHLPTSHAQTPVLTTSGRVLPGTLLTACPIMFQLKHQTTLSTADKVNPDAPPLGRAMKRPILTGRNSKTHGHDIKDVIPNPFVGRALPFGRRVVYTNQLDEDLAKGEYWSKFIDRSGQFQDYDMIARGWGNDDLYKTPAWKQPFDDITNHNDIDFNFRMSNLGMHVEMVKHIPHLKPLLPEIRSKYNGLARTWQDIVSQVMDKKEKSFELNTTITDDWRRGPNNIARAKERLEKELNGTTAEKRLMDVKKKISFETVKKFCDNKADEHEWVKVIFIDAQGTKHYVYGMVGETLLQCCRRYSIPIDGYCNSYDRGHVRAYGTGAWCAQCQMDISPKYFHLMPAADWREKKDFWKFKEITPTSRLGCCVWIRPEFDGMVVNIPKSLVIPYGNFDE